MIEDEFLGIDQCPENVFIRVSQSHLQTFAGRVFLLAFDVPGGGSQFLFVGLAGVGPVIELPNLILMRALRIGGQAGCAGLAGRQLFVNVRRVKKMQALGKIGVFGSFALACAGVVGPAEEGKKVGLRIETIVWQLDRARTSW